MDHSTEPLKAIAILVSPTGDAFFAAYGPMTKDHRKATVFASREVAEKVEQTYFGRHTNSFWECERQSAAIALKKYAGWTSKVIQLTADQWVEDLRGIRHLADGFEGLLHEHAS